MSATQSWFGREARKFRSTRSAGRSTMASEVVVTLKAPLRTPLSPDALMRRSTVLRATGIPSRQSCNHTLRAP
jgi:hypothetical protein